MTEEQERTLIEAVERLSVHVQRIASRSWSAMGMGESQAVADEAAAVNVDLCRAFPYLYAPDDPRHRS